MQALRSPRLSLWEAGGPAGRAASEKSNLAPQDCRSSAPKPWPPPSCAAGRPSLPGAERGAGGDTGRRTGRAEITLQLRDLTQVFGLRRPTRVFHCGARRTLEAILSGSGGPEDPRRAPPAPLPAPPPRPERARRACPGLFPEPRAPESPGGGGGQAWARQALGPRAAAGPRGMSKSSACKPRCGPRPHTRPPQPGPHTRPLHTSRPHTRSPSPPVPHTLPSSAPCNRAPTLAPFTPRAPHALLLGPPQPRPRTPPRAPTPANSRPPAPPHPPPHAPALPRPLTSSSPRPPGSGGGSGLAVPWTPLCWLGPPCADPAQARPPRGGPGSDPGPPEDPVQSRPAPATTAARKGPVARPGLRPCWGKGRLQVRPADPGAHSEPRRLGTWSDSGHPWVG